MNQVTTEPREMLKQIVSRNGQEILEDTSRCEGLLKDHCGMHRKEISALVGALEERVPAELKSSWQTAMSPEAMRARLVKRMEDNRGLSPDLADWAVDTWSYALGVGLGRRSDRVANVVVPSSKPQSKPAPAVNPALAAELGAAAFVARPQASNPTIDAQTSVPADSQTPAAKTAPWSSEKKAVAAVAAAVALYFGYTHMPHPGANQVQHCAEGQVQAADGTCVAGKGGLKGGPKGQTPQDQPKDGSVKTATGLAAGASIRVTVAETLNSDTVSIGQYVRGIVNAPVVLNGKTMVPEGTRVVLQVRGVDQSGKVVGVAKIDLALVEMNVNGKKYNVAGASGVVKGPSQTVQTVKKAGIWGGIGTAAGCGIGKLTGHTGVGCATGAAGGVGTGVLLASKNKPQPAVLEPGKVVSFKLGQPLNLA